MENGNCYLACYLPTNYNSIFVVWKISCSDKPYTIAYFSNDDNISTYNGIFVDACNYENTRRLVKKITLIIFQDKMNTLKIIVKFCITLQNILNSIFKNNKILKMIIQPFKLERFYSIHEFTAKYLLCSSDCESMTIGDLLQLEEGSTEKFHQQWLGYTETKGDPDLRRDISSIYSNINEGDILVCAGAQEPIFLFCQAMLKVDDEVIIQFPCYQSIQSIPESMGCNVINWNVEYNSSKPVFDIDELEKLITHKTKVIFLNSPHNPTGHHFSKEEQLRIVEIARKNNCIIFCDEVYRELEHNPTYKIPAFADVYENGVSLCVMSKAYGLPGLRIGWVATKQKRVLEKMAILKEYTTICNAAPSEFLAGVALRNRDKILKRNIDIVDTNISLLNIFFTKYPQLFSWYQPFAGPISFVRMNFDTDDLVFANKVVKEKNVLLLPGDVYDYKGYFRVGFGRKNMPIALEKFEEFVTENLIRC
jgi:aspartate/methionine/tyrosine aminotransferase